MSAAPVRPYGGGLTPPEVLMDTPYQAAPDVHVFPANVTLPGTGVLPVNAFLLMAEEPVLVDSGLAVDGDDFVAALSSVIDPRDLRWVWLTHDDADHTGNLQRVMELAPRARLVTHGFAALRMSTWWPVPMDRVHAVRPGDAIAVGDRTLTAVTPPLFDNPMSIGVLDGATGALFSVDAFGAILPEPTQHASDVPPEALAGGMLGWATSDSPWAHLVDRARFGEVLRRVHDLQPTRILSAHLPAAGGTSLDEFLAILARVPDAEPDVPPDHEQFTQMIEAMNRLQRQGVPVPAPAG
ncbi:MBL fold metallo-hydrolase [Geodermatophilus sp. SYSU D00815]